MCVRGGTYLLQSSQGKKGKKPPSALGGKKEAVVNVLTEGWEIERKSGNVHTVPGRKKRGVFMVHV